MSTPRAVKDWTPTELAMVLQALRENERDEDCSDYDDSECGQFYDGQ